MTPLGRWWMVAGLLITVPAPSQAGASDLCVGNRTLFRSVATQAMRVRRLAHIGLLRRFLSAEDGDAIHATAHAMAEDARAALDRRDRAWAVAYDAGLRDGAMRSADPVDVTDAASRRRFAEPGGSLNRVLTWTGKPPRSVNGILMRPRTMP